MENLILGVLTIGMAFGCAFTFCVIADGAAEAITILIHNHNVRRRLARGG